MSKLKPCPFCGSEDNIALHVDETGECKTSFVRCMNCCADATIYDSCSSGGNICRMATEAWNTRPIEDALRAEFAEKNAEIEQLRCELSRKNEALMHIEQGHFGNSFEAMAIAEKARKKEYGGSAFDPTGIPPLRQRPIRPDEPINYNRYGCLVPESECP